MTVGKYLRSNPSAYSGRTVFRVNAGLEDAPDLIADLKNGLRHLEPSREQADA